MRNASGIAIAAAAAVFCLAGCGGGGGSNEGILSFTSLSYAVNENGTPLNDITVQRLGGDGAVGATVVLESVTATPASDYVATQIPVSWDAGDVSPKVISVPILDDHLDEPAETLTLRLVNPTGGATIRHPLGDSTLNIVDDDDAGTIQFSTPVYFFGEDGTALGLEVTVVRVGGVDGDVTASLHTVDGTANSDPASAVEPVDYLPVSTSVSFADQDATPVVVSFAGVVLQDLLPELDEVLNVELADPTNGAAIGLTSPASLTIFDDDPFLEIPNPEPGTLFGTTVAKRGPHLLVGAPGNAAPSGRVHVIDPSNGTAVDTISRPFSNQLGRTLAIDGSTLAIGSPGNVWVLEAATLADRFLATSPLPGFGDALGIFGDRIAIGAPDAPVGGGLAPAGVVLVRDVLSGAPLQSIDGTADGRLGAAFATLGEDLLIGEPAGAGRVLQYAGTPLALAFVFDDPAPQAPPTAFGSALATSALTPGFFAGAPDADVGGAVDGGAVHLVSAGGVQTASLAVAGAKFGTRLFPIADRICIQAPGDGPLGSGRVHVWDQSLLFSYPSIDDPSPAPGAGFGAAMCEYDGVLVIGAPHQVVGGAPDRGSVFLFRLN
jgi:hypothetical protein